MPGDESRIAREIDPGFRFKHAQRRERDRHECGLRILGEGQCLSRPIPHRLAELLPERGIDFLENPACRRE